MNVICFDIEATDNGEILELSVFSYPEIKEIYHSLFLPEKAKEWPTTEKIHHITPQMVANAPLFSARRKEIQRIIDKADMIVGFALDNDLRYMKNNGIKVTGKAKIDTRELFLVAKGEEFGMEYGSAPRLAKCAELMGLDFSETEDAHSATNDTRATLQLLKLLLKDYNGNRLTTDLPTRIETRMEQLYQEQLKKNAHGVLRLQPVEGGGYRLKNNKFDSTKTPEPIKGEYSIIVESRFAAEHDLRLAFAHKADKMRAGVYRLRKADIDKFLAYTNTFNAIQELVCRNRYGYRRARNHLDFDIK